MSKKSTHHEQSEISAVKSISLAEREITVAQMERRRHGFRGPMRGYLESKPHSFAEVWEAVLQRIRHQAMQGSNRDDSATYRETLASALKDIDRPLEDVAADLPRLLSRYDRLHAEVKNARDSRGLARESALWLALQALQDLDDLIR